MDPGALLHGLPDAVLLLDTDANLIWGNRAAEALFGRSLDESVGLSGFDFIHPDDAELALVSLAAVVDKDVGTPLELRIRAADGWRLVELLGAARDDGLVIVLRDLTERRRWEVARDEEVRFRSLIQNASAVTLLLDAHGRVRSSSTGLTRLLGLDQAWMEGRPITDLVRGPDRHVLGGALHQLLGRPDGAAGGRTEVDVSVRRPDGTSLPVSVGLVDLLDDPTVEGVVATIHDITRRVKAEDELRRANALLASQASHDPLTGLANQVLFREQVATAARRLSDPTRLAVLFIDLDDFKNVNDSLGHSAGDQLLVEVSDRLRRCVRGVDTVARLGGDEFAVLVDELEDEAEAIEIAERILRALSRPITVAARSVSTGASVGIAFGRSGDGVDELLRNADLAMYHAKNSGRRQYRTYEPRMHDAALQRLEVDSLLRGAAARGELVVHYQPIVELRSGDIRAVEALVRWSHPDRGLLLPGEFVPFAEDSGVIDEIGSHVLFEACREARRWGIDVGEHAAPAVTVNVSPHQLLDETLPERVAEVLSSTGIEPSRLVLEITEGALMQDPATAAGRLEELTRVGVRLAVDDFGTGHSSLAHLQRFPIDTLKIDRSFITDVEEHTGSSLVQAIVQLAHTLGMTTIAEGVETVGQRERLAELGCDLAQGYLYHRPAPVGQVRATVLDGVALST